MVPGLYSIMDHPLVRADPSISDDVQKRLYDSFVGRGSGYDSIQEGKKPSKDLPLRERIDLYRLLHR